MIKFDTWLNNILKNYYVEYLHTENTEDDFIAYKYSFEDPQNNGLPFDIYLNRNKEPTILTSDIFPFKWFNVAEGYMPEMILDAADDIFAGRLMFNKHAFNRYSLVFGNKSDIVSTKNNKKAKLDSKIIDGFCIGYSKK